MTDPLRSVEPYYADDQVTLHLGDALDVLRTLPSESVGCIVTSPPYYGLRDYGMPGQYGLEDTPAEYVTTLCRLFAEARRALAADGTCWINLGDCYVAHSAGDGSSRRRDKQGAATGRAPRTADTKNLLGIPWRIAFALQDEGWILRNDIVWHKPNATPESVKDRLATRYEHLFLLTKSRRYFFDLDAIRIPHAHPAAALHLRGANPGDVWRIPTRRCGGGHYASFPLDLPLRCIASGCKAGAAVLDPFSGSGTTGAAARLLGRNYIGIDLNPTYHDLAIRRFAQGVLDASTGAAA